MGNNHYRRKEEESKRMYYLGKRRKVSNRMCLFGETLNVWCSTASAAVVSATTVGATKIGVTSDVLYGATVVHQWSV